MSLAKRSLVIGQCLPSSVKNAIKVQFTFHELDENLRKYYPMKRVLYAYDKTNKCKPGDIVLVKQCAEQKVKEITHETVKIVFPLGDVTDPLTGRKTFAAHFKDTMYERYKSVGPQPGGYIKYTDELKEKQK